MIRFEDLVEKVRGNNPDADVELLRRAYVFSAYEHKGQVRHSGEPYLVHPLEVADLLADMKLDVVAIASGLLHDIVEDTATSIERIKELFGTDIAHVVEGVTKLGAIPFSSSEERQAENFRKMLLAMIDDIRVILVKLADGEGRAGRCAGGAARARRVQGDRRGEDSRRAPEGGRFRRPRNRRERARGGEGDRCGACVV